MDEVPQKLKTAIARLREDLEELEAWFPQWHASKNYDGSRKIKGVARRVVLSAERVNELVRENTFSR